MVGAALLLAAVFSTPSPFALVNGTGATIEAVSIRASDGTSGWRSLGIASLPRGARVALPAASGDLCAFDLRARLGGTEVVWSSVNLCDVRAVTLNRRPDGTLWVDYD